MTRPAASSATGRKSLVRQSGLTSVAAAAGVASGLLLDVVIAARFGAGRVSDAFFVGARIPLGLAAIVMVAANQAVVPRVSTWLVQKGEREAWRLVSLLLTATVLGGALVAGLGALAAWPLVRATAPGLDRQQVDLAVAVVRIMLLTVPLTMVAEVVRSVLNARYAFVAPAAMHVVLNGVAAAIVLGLGSDDVRMVGWAYVGGSGVQLAFLLVMLRRQGVRYRPSLRLRDPDLLDTGRLAVRPVVAAGLNPLARVGEQLFVSFLPPGSITVVNYGNRLISAVGGSVFFRSVMVALIPRLTEAHARGDQPAVFSITRWGASIMVALSLPLTAFAAVLAQPAALVLFRRGNFSRDDAALLGVVLAVYSASLLGSALQRAFLAPFFARLDTRTPLRNTVYGVGSNLLLLPLFVLPFQGRDGAVVGVAVAYSLSQYVHLAHAWIRLRAVLGLQLEGLGRWFLRLLLASLASAAVMTGGYVGLDLGARLSRLDVLARSAAVGIAGAAAFALVVVVAGGGEVRSVFRSPRKVGGPGRRDDILPYHEESISTADAMIISAEVPD